jgi:hypothetical protein
MIAVECDEGICLHGHFTVCGVSVRPGLSRGALARVSACLFPRGVRHDAPWLMIARRRQRFISTIRAATTESSVIVPRSEDTFDSRTVAAIELPPPFALRVQRNGGRAYKYPTARAVRSGAGSVAASAGCHGFLVSVATGRRGCRHASARRLGTGARDELSSF